MGWAAHAWNRLQSLGFAVFAGALVVGLVALYLPLARQQHQLQQELQRLEREIARQEALEKQQRAEIEALKTDPGFVERTARDKLNLARPNETVFQFEPPTNRPGAKQRSP
jgi:cell division protein FtsB